MLSNRGQLSGKGIEESLNQSNKKFASKSSLDYNYSKIKNKMIMGIKEQLENKGLRATNQRIAMLEYLQSTKVHPTAEQIKAAIEQDMPIANMATVYNNLKAFVAVGLVKEFSLSPKEPSHYDGNIERHHHFIDQQKGKIYDLPLERAQVQFDLPEGFDVQDTEVTFYGHRKETS